MSNWSDQLPLNIKISQFMFWAILNQRCLLRESVRGNIIIGMKIWLGWFFCWESQDPKSGQSTVVSSANLPHTSLFSISSRTDHLFEFKQLSPHFWLFPVHEVVISIVSIYITLYVRFKHGVWIVHSYIMSLIIWIFSKTGRSSWTGFVCFIISTLSEGGVMVDEWQY